jgi:hypothetical protein
VAAIRRANRRRDGNFSLLLLARDFGSRTKLESCLQSILAAFLHFLCKALTGFSFSPKPAQLSCLRISCGCSKNQCKKKWLPIFQQPLFLG